MSHPFFNTSISGNQSLNLQTRHGPYGGDSQMGSPGFGTHSETPPNIRQMTSPEFAPFTSHQTGEFSQSGSFAALSFHQGCKAPESSPPPAEAGKPARPAETIDKILLRFGLVKEDLKYLESYSENEITTESLPLILQHISIQKKQRSQPTTGQPNQVIDYGHSEKYTYVDFGKRQSQGDVGDTGPMHTLRNAQQKPVQSSGLVSGKKMAKEKHVEQKAKPQTHQRDGQEQRKRSSWKAGRAFSHLISSQRSSLAKVPVRKRPFGEDLPPSAMMDDCAGSTPRTFPHTCTLCDKECSYFKDWRYHLKSGLHTENCRLLQKKYPAWEGHAQPSFSEERRASESSPSSYQTLQPRHHQTEPSFSLRCHFGSQRERLRGRSCSSTPNRHHSTNSSFCPPNTDHHRQSCRSARRDEGLCEARRTLQSERANKTDDPKPGRPVSRRSKYSAKFATELLVNLGLENQDLEELEFYSTDEITPENLPRILMDIRIQKEKRAAEKSRSRATTRRSLKQRSGSSAMEGNGPKVLHSVPKRSYSRGDGRPLRSDIAALEEESSSSHSKTPPQTTKSKLKARSKLNDKTQDKREKVQRIPTKNLKVQLKQLLGPALKKPAEEEGPLFKDQPSLAMIIDFSGTKPRTFPYTCSLCDSVSSGTQDWFHHRRTRIHLQNCRTLQKQYPEWIPRAENAASFQRRRHKSRPEESPPPQSPGRCCSWEGGREASSSPRRGHSECSSFHSHSPATYCSLTGQWRYSRSRSPPSPPGSYPRRGSRDSGDRSRSPLSCRRRKRSRSWSPPIEARFFSQSRSGERGSSGRSQEFHSPERSLSKPDDQTPDSRRQSHERRALKKKKASEWEKSNSAEILAKKLLEASAVQSLSSQTDLENMVKTLTPVLLAEVRKMKSKTSCKAAKNKSAKSLKTKKVVKAKAAVSKKPLTTSKNQIKPLKKKLKQAEEGTVKAVKKTKSSTLKSKDQRKPEPKRPRTSSVQTKPAAAKRRRLVVTATYSRDPVTSLTVGERIGKKLELKNLWPVDLEGFLSNPNTKKLLITNLPKYFSGCYTEEDFVRLLQPFGVKNKDEIYVIPQKRMAVAFMPSVDGLEAALRAAQDGLPFKGSTLRFQALRRLMNMSPFGFYKSLMLRMHCKVTDDGTSIVYVKNICLKEARDLRNYLNNLVSIRNFLHLLNKLYIEFESSEDADWIGAFYSSMTKPVQHTIKRLKVPEGSTTTKPLAVAAETQAAAGVKLPKAGCGVPQGTRAPLWVTMRASPFLFPTVSPWFSIPDFVPVEEEMPAEAVGGAALSPTVMLTGFRGSTWKQEDVVQLVQPHFPDADPHSLLFKVVVLPLQRRAFVHFTSWASCCAFLKEHVACPVSAHGCPLHVQLVSEAMSPASTEEGLYRSLMKWSNSQRRAHDSLSERLLCVELPDTSADLVMKVVNLVASVAPFVDFLVLAERIYIEMCDSSGVVKLVSHHATGLLSRSKCWTKVRLVRALMGVQRCVQESSVTTTSPTEPAGGAAAETRPASERPLNAKPDLSAETMPPPGADGGWGPLGTTPQPGARPDPPSSGDEDPSEFLLQDFQILDSLEE